MKLSYVQCLYALAYKAPSHIGGESSPRIQQPGAPFGQLLKAARCDAAVAVASPHDRGLSLLAVAVGLGLVATTRITTFPVASGAGREVELVAGAPHDVVVEIDPDAAAAPPDLAIPSSAAEAALDLSTAVQGAAAQAAPVGSSGCSVASG